MRNGVLGVMGNLVVLRLSEDDLTENMKNTRDQILDHLEVGCGYILFCIVEVVACWCCYPLPDHILLCHSNVNPLNYSRLEPYS